MAAVDPAARIVSIKNGIDFAGGIVPTRVVNVQFMVPPNGPFTLTYAQPDYTAEKVAADINAEVTRLRTLGAIS
jgi:hypothetical protein